MQTLWPANSSGYHGLNRKPTTTIMDIDQWHITYSSRIDTYYGAGLYTAGGLPHDKLSGPATFVVEVVTGEHQQ